MTALSGSQSKPPALPEVGDFLETYIRMRFRPVEIRALPGNTPIHPELMPQV